MSVQLIVYPQNYEGEYNVFSLSTNDMLVNGINFIGLNGTSSYDYTGTNGINAQVNAINNQAPSINVWKRYRTTGSGTPTLPVVTSGNLVLTSASTDTASGVYQKLSNLNVGQTYTLSIISSSIPSGKYQIGIFNGTSLSNFSTNYVPSTTMTWTFTANNTEMTIAIGYQHTSSSIWTITQMNVQPLSASPNLTNFDLEDGQVICDLYEDEDIPLSLSVDNFKNAAEKVQSYSKAFKLPATKRNNLIFDNMFEITRSDDGIIFNPYNKTECVLKQDGFILFKGYLKMLDITDKDGEISYNINLYSEVVALADILKDRTFSEISFIELEHEYNKTNITRSWNDVGASIGYQNPDTSGYRNTYTTLRYPFVDWEGQVIISDGVLGNSGNPQLPSLESVFRPFIQIKYLINRIFEGTPFTWESNFFNTDEFEKLYMDFNWGSGNAPVEIDGVTTVGAYTGVDTGDNFAVPTYTPMILSASIPFIGMSPPPQWDLATSSITSTVVNETWQFDYSYTIDNIDTVDRTVECRFLYNNTQINYSGVQTILAGDSFIWIGSTIPITMLTVGDTIKVEFRTNAGTINKVKQSTATSVSAFYTCSLTMTRSATALTSGMLIQNLRGELGQWDFLKGIITMFNLVSLPDEDNPNNITFEPYGDVFHTDTSSGDMSDLTLASRSIQYDWTDRIDVSEMKLTPLTDLNKKTIFKFVEDEDDHAFNVYKKAVGGYLYGSKLFDASLGSNGLDTILQGTDEIVAEPFAATIIKPLMEFFGIIIPNIYAMDDDEFEGFENAPRILYNNGIKETGIDYYIPEQNGVPSSIQPDYLQFSHLTDIPTIVSNPTESTDTSDFNFGECQLVFGQDSSVRNLYNLYWSPYYNELYNADTRIMTIKVNLSPSDINTFKFNDTVMIKNREFRVNKIDYKPNDLATVEFILIP